MKSATEVFRPLQADDPVEAGGYRLAARLGAGGMGRVYLSHTRGGRPVAIKVVRPELADDPDFRRRFRREMEAARRVRGAYTAELIDGDADGTPPWLATLYVPGPSLSEAVARRGPLPVPAVLWLMAGVAEALQAIHGVGVVHRDLKPGNVLLAADGPRVIDFGISLASGVSSHTATGAAVGTPSFMAPEQASAGEVTPATDIFALGQTAAFAALGRPLYGDGPGVSVLYRIVHSDPDLSLLPEQLRPLIARCLAAEPAERVTAKEVVEWCRRHLGGDLDAGVGPAVWREVKGPDPEIPPPVPEPTPVAPVAMPTPVLTPGAMPASPGVPAPVLPSAPAPLPPSAPWPRPHAPSGRADEPAEERRARRRRTALVATGAVAAAALLLTGVTLLVGDALDRLADRGAKGPSSASSHPTGATGSTASPGPTASTASQGSTGTEGTAGGTGVPAAPSAGPSASPRPVGYPGRFLDEKNSLGIRKPVDRKDRSGDLRLECDRTGCELKSDSSSVILMYGEPGTGLDECRLMATASKSHSLPLAAVSAGSEICVRHPSGDIALLVVQVKATAMPGRLPAFMTVDLTVWPNATERGATAGR
ncbi:serine/threonine-protein kinase [Streptomyces sp. NPDC127114]|uniref:serine/threonine-protein kinase n=1 Tax=Streptomyces sp. NPDC127114 TaxID=3345366 RepID=UPI00363956E9